jgi:hypothetical protein
MRGQRFDCFRSFIVGGLGAAALASAASATIYTGAGGTIPDNDPAGFVSEIVIDDEFVVDDLTINLNGLFHTWIGDLVVFVSYDGIDGTAGSSLFDRVGKTNATTGFGDNSNLAGTYSFNDGGGDLWAAAAAASGSGDVVAPGVYFASGGLGPAQLSLNGLFGGLNAKGHVEHLDRRCRRWRCRNARELVHRLREVAGSRSRRLHAAWPRRTSRGAPTSSMLNGGRSA